MTEELKIGIEAVNRWLFHGWNYDIAEVAIPDYPNRYSKNVTIPRFLAEVKWTCNLPHMIEKWKEACWSRNTDAYMVTFYANLDNENRRRLLEWVLQNYTNECKLF